MSKFIQLTKQDCEYLLDLIEDLDRDTEYTRIQRSYTKNLLEKILENPNNAKLGYKDVDYLLDLVDDDETNSLNKGTALATLLAIQQMQRARLSEFADVFNQRDLRKARRRIKI